MNDLISRQAAIDAIRTSTSKYTGFMEMYTDDDAVEAINGVPTADVVEADKAQKEIDYWHDKAQIYEQTILKLSLNKADVVEVVRCEDCKHYVLHTLFGRTQGWCERLCDKFDKSLAHGTEGDDFCSYGEKRDD